MRLGFPRVGGCADEASGAGPLSTYWRGTGLAGARFGPGGAKVAVRDGNALHHLGFSANHRRAQVKASTPTIMPMYALPLG